MKSHLQRPSSALIISVLALVVATAGSAGALPGQNSVTSNDIAPNTVRARDLAPLKLRSGKVRDLDTTAGDGLFAVASGVATCRRGEQLVSGGLRVRGAVSFGPERVSMIDSGPVPTLRRWGVSMNSDLGGAAQRKFTVFAYCLVK